MTLELQFPLKGFSANLAYTTSKQHRRVSLNDKLKQWRKVISDCLHRNKVPKILGNVRVTYQYVFPDYTVRDLDNFDKTLSDALKNIVFEDDRYIKEKKSSQIVVKGESQIYVKIERLFEGEVTQLSTDISKHFRWSIIHTKRGMLKIPEKAVKAPLIEPKQKKRKRAFEGIEDM